MRVLVTGAAGFIGSHLSERLHSLGHDVVALDCLTPYYAAELKQVNINDLQAQGMTITLLDLAEDDLTSALDGVEFVYHLAAQPGISAGTSFATYLRNNVQATFNLLEAAKQVPEMRCFVNIATSSIYGRFAFENEEAPPQPTSHYGVTKLAAEQMALSYQREQGFPACSLRIFSVLGPRERPEKLYTKLIRSILLDEPFPLFAGARQHSRSYTAVPDIIDGFVAVLENPEKAVGEIFNIGSDKEITTKQGIALVETIMGRKARFEMLPARAGDQVRTHANIEKARSVLGYAPGATLESILTAQVEWYTEKIYRSGLYRYG